MINTQDMMKRPRIGKGMEIGVKMGMVGMMVIGLVGRVNGEEADGWSLERKVDRESMGDYEGVWVGAKGGSYYQINPQVVAQVVERKQGEYWVRIMEQHDVRAECYFEGLGVEQGGVIRFEGNGWKGQVEKGVMTGESGAGPGGGGVKFEMKKVVRVSPTLGLAKPQGAVSLFDGKGFDEWQHGDGRPVSWKIVEGGVMEVRSARSKEERQAGVGGDIQSKKRFKNFRMHLEFRYPLESGRVGQARGNSGVFVQDNYEIQVLNSYGLMGNWNECGAFYKTSPPRVNAARPPSEWQTYDIEYESSEWKDGKKVKMPRATVWHNGVLIHQSEEIPHATSHSLAGRKDEPQGPGVIRLQDHGTAIQYRHIWVEERP